MNQPGGQSGQAEAVAAANGLGSEITTELLVRLSRIAAQLNVALAEIGPLTGSETARAVVTTPSQHAALERLLTAHEMAGVEIWSLALQIISEQKLIVVENAQHPGQVQTEPVAHLES